MHEEPRSARKGMLHPCAGAERRAGRAAWRRRAAGRAAATCTAAAWARQATRCCEGGGGGGRAPEPQHGWLCCGQTREGTGRGTTQTRMQSLITNPLCGFWEVVWEVLAWRCMTRARTLDRPNQAALQHAMSGVFWGPWGCCTCVLDAHIP